MAFDQGQVHLQAKILCRIGAGTKPVETTVGRVLLYKQCPPEVPFELVNNVMGKKQLAELIDNVYRACGQKSTVLLADSLRTMGFKLSTLAGVSICISDMAIPPAKYTIIDGCACSIPIRPEITGHCRTK